MNKQIEEVLIKNKPSITESSKKTYISLIKNIFKNMDEPFNNNFFKDKQNEVLSFLEKFNLNSKKTNLAAIVLFNLPNIVTNDKYRHLMIIDIKKKDVEDQKQEKNEKQIKNSITQKEINDLYKYYYNKYISLKIKPDTKLNNKDYIIYQTYILLSLLTLIEPRRLMDYTNLKYDSFNETSNDFIKKTIIYKNYKTKKTYGNQIVNIPDKLVKILNQFVKYRKHNNDNGFIFIDQSGDELSTSQLNQLINKIFSDFLGRKLNIGMNGIRHEFLSDKYKNIPALLELQKTASNMGHSIDQALLYIKK